ncbi:DUF4190 domain-containing protein [Peribacillus alkalitolerans]|uniref:DUF4190 domain-containing protein n=1 Tax=Peribacillus alkalitolerans TaxID=1550385 RepID=UPI0013D34C52|nr:DUF4190 domain-containing protein [Peribacillus alkalitolerans]
MVKKNSKSIASLILGILSIIIPTIGLIFGVIGIIISRKSIKEIDNSNETGRGLAISGKVCSIVGICIQVLLTILAILGILSYFVVDETIIK